MSIERFTETITADGSGAVTAFLPSDFCHGRVITVKYGGGLGAGATITLTSAALGYQIWTASGNSAVTAHPRAEVVDPDNNALLYSTGNPVESYFRLTGDRIQVVVSGADADSSAQFDLIMEDLA